MLRLLVIIVLIVSISCNSDKSETQDSIASVQTEEPINPITTVTDRYAVWTSEPYELKLDMTPLEDGVFDMVIRMNLKGGAHYVSPNAKRDFKGKFMIKIDDTDKLEHLSELLETPRSVEEFDPHPFVNGNVNWVRENTRYNRQLKPLVENNFSVNGLIQFTIEPQCTLEKIPFVITYEDGHMWVEIARC